MIKLTYHEVLTALGGRPVGASSECSVSGASIDSRTVEPGDLFFALPGARTDGHAFVADALKRGAVAAVIRADAFAELEQCLSPAAAARLILVDDVVAALGRLGHYHRRQLSAEVIAVVGSNGKTTTKAMIDHVLSDELKGHCSPKSYNNAIGVPLTLLSGEAADDYLVVEIGTNAPGEIAALAALAEPDQVVVTCIGAEHLEGLGDLTGVAREELSILASLGEGALAVLNADAPYVGDADLPPGVTVVRFGRSERADLRVTRAVYEDPWLRFTLNGRFDYALNMPGEHNALNAAAAVAVGLRFGRTHEQIAARLEAFVPPPMRSEVLRLGGVTLINDAYNANPHSAMSAIEMLEALPCDGRRIAVFGEMCELGDAGPELHRSVAQRLREAAGHVVLVGRAADWMAPELSGEQSLFTPHVDRCADVDECRARLLDIVREGDVVLLKASRAVGLERLVEPLRQQISAGAVT